MENPVDDPMKTIESFNRLSGLNEGERKAGVVAWAQETYPQNGMFLGIIRFRLFCLRHNLLYQAQHIIDNWNNSFHFNCRIHA